MREGHSYELYDCTLPSTTVSKLQPPSRLSLISSESSSDTAKADPEETTHPKVRIIVGAGVCCRNALGILRDSYSLTAASSSGMTQYDSFLVDSNGASFNSLQSRQQRHEDCLNDTIKKVRDFAQPGHPVSTLSPSQLREQSQREQPSGEQGQQATRQRCPYPWSQRRLLLPPPVIIPKPGVTPPTTPSPPPFPRYAPSLPATTTSTGDLFLFGGLAQDQVRNDLYLFSTSALSATLLHTMGAIPSPRVGHASALVGSVLIVWGGVTKGNSKAKPGEKQDDGLYLLNLSMCHLPHQQSISRF